MFIVYYFGFFVFVFLVIFWRAFPTSWFRLSACAPFCSSPHVLSSAPCACQSRQLFLGWSQWWCQHSWSWTSDVLSLLKCDLWGRERERECVWDRQTERERERDEISADEKGEIFYRAHLWQANLSVPCLVLLALWSRWHRLEPRWPHPTAGWLGCGEELERWPHAASVLHSAGFPWNQHW